MQTLNLSPDGGAVQFFDKRHRLVEKKLRRDQSRRGLEMSVGKRWRSPQRPDAAVIKPTKSEAIAWFKALLGVKKLPDGFVIEVF